MDVAIVGGIVIVVLIFAIIELLKLTGLFNFNDNENE